MDETRASSDLAARFARVSEHLSSGLVTARSCARFCVPWRDVLVRIDSHWVENGAENGVENGLENGDGNGEKLREVLGEAAAACLNEQSGEQDVRLSLCAHGDTWVTCAKEIGRMVKLGAVVELEVNDWNAEMMKEFMTCATPQEMRRRKKNAGAAQEDTAMVKVAMIGAEVQAEMCAAFFRNMERLEEIELSGCGIDERGMTAIAEGVLDGKLKLIRRLGLERNKINSAAISAVISILDASHHMEELCLAGNIICASGMESLASHVQNLTMLSLLDLSDNPIPLLFALKCLVEPLESKTAPLRKLILRNLEGCADDLVLNALAIILEQNERLVVVDIQSNQEPSFTSSALQGVAASLRKNSCIENIIFPELKTVGSDCATTLAVIRKSLHLNKRISLGVSHVSSSSSAASSSLSNTSVPPILAFIEQEANQEVLLEPDRSPRQNSTTSGSSLPSIIPANSGVASVGHIDSPKKEKAMDCIDEREENILALDGFIRETKKRSKTHAREINARMSRRAGNLDARVDRLEQRFVNLLDMKDRKIEEKRRDPHHLKRVAERTKQIEKRIHDLELHLRKAAEQCQALANVEKNVSVELDAMKRLLESTSASGEDDSRKMVPFGKDDEVAQTLIKDSIDRNFLKCRSQVLALQSTYSHDFEQKQKLWKSKFDQSIRYLVSRVANLESSVISIADDNIYTLEALLTHRQDRRVNR